MKKLTKSVIVGLFAVIVILGGVAWYQYNRAEKARRQIELNATSILREVLIAKRDLRVGQISGDVVSVSNYKGPIFRPVQKTKAPVSVNYLLDLRKMRASDLRWDSDYRRITVIIPDITIEAPRIDFMQAEIEQKGIWIGRGAGIIMQRQAAERIVARANERARDAANIAKARQQAVEFVKDLVRRPLAAVGYEPVEVRVLAPWDEAKPLERWDVSRSPEEVLSNGR